jgi:hypothetical protein
MLLLLLLLLLVMVVVELVVVVVLLLLLLLPVALGSLLVFLSTSLLGVGLLLASLTWPGEQSGRP